MISWIQRYFQHHFRVIFAILLGVIIISFVFTIGAAPGIGRGDRQMVNRQFFDYNLSLQSDQQRLMGDASLSANLRVGAFGNLDADQIQNYAFQRAGALHLADEWHLPAATPGEIEAQIKTLRRFSGPDGQFDPKVYQTFRDELKTTVRGVTEGDVARVIGNDVRAEKVQNLLAGPGYVMPAEVKNQIARADSSWTLATATADFTAFKPEIKPTEAELTQFFEQSGGRYDIPPQVVVSYVEFPAASYVASVNVTEPEVRAFYDSNPSRFPKPVAAAKPPTALLPSLTPPADPGADFTAVRPQVEAALKLERAQTLAAKAASNLSLALYESKARTSEAVDALLGSKQLTAKTLPPFGRDAPPPQFSGSADVATEAFRLNKDRPISDAITTPTGAVILFWKDTQASRKPLFTEVRERVSADYTENERRKRFVELGKTIKAELETRLKAGDAFEKAVAAATSLGLKLEPKTLPPFTLRTRPQDIDYSVLGTLERLEKGQVSDMVVSADKGLFVYAVDKKAPDITEANPQFVETRQQIASYNGRASASAYISELVEQELKKSQPKVQ